MKAIILLAIAIVVTVRGLLLNSKRKKWYKKYMDNIINPMRYIVQLQDEGLLAIWYRIDDKKNQSYIDGTMRRLLNTREEMLCDIDDSNIWKCFLWRIDFESVEDTYEYLHEIYWKLYESILKREKLTVQEMIQMGCTTWEEYAERKIASKDAKNNEPNNVD